MGPRLPYPGIGLSPRFCQLPLDTPLFISVVVLKHRSSPIRCHSNLPHLEVTSSRSLVLDALTLLELIPCGFGNLV